MRMLTSTEVQGRRITFLYDNQRYFLEKYYLYSPKKHEYLDYIEKYQNWSSYEPEEEGILIAYASIHVNTKQAAEKMRDILIEKGA